MRRFVGFLLLLGLAVGGVYWLRAPRGSTAADVLQDVKDDARKAGQSVRDLLKKDGEPGGESTSTRVVRKAREVGAKVADATADARTTAAIKLKLAADPDLS